jgi:RNA polymerase sigma-B factor
MTADPALLLAARAVGTSVGRRRNPAQSSDYADVAEMFRHLQTLCDTSVAFQRQRDAIILRCLPLAEHIACRFRNRGEPHEDLVQVARVGLINAVNRFDVDHHDDFLAFAVPTITGEVRRHFRDHGWSVKVPRRLKELHLRCNQARGELSQRLGRTPTATEIAEYLDIDRETVIEVTVAGSCYSTISTDLHLGAGDDFKPIHETYGDTDSGFDTVLDIETVRPSLSALPERERTVLRLKFLENMTQTQISSVLGISQMHVSRLLSRALTTVRMQALSPEPD